MEIQGYDSTGSLVRAPVGDLVEKLRRPGEVAQMSPLPHVYSFSDGRGGEARTVDLQEMAQAAGMTSVAYNFDPAAARKAGLIQDREVDSGIAYNLERIERDVDKLDFLKTKGYQNVVRSGDDYYATTGAGKFEPINNRDGLDWSDVIRMGAHAGRDVAAGVAGAYGVAAAVGGGVVAGPAGAAAGLAAGAAAGAAGGVAGETAQRLLDKGLGAEADRYNSELGVGDEAARLGRSAGMGALGGATEFGAAVAGPALRAGVAPVTKNFGEWGAREAAKAQAGWAAARLPGGYMQRFASPEQAVAQDLLNEGIQAVGRKAMTPGELGEVTKEATELAAGAAKPTGDVAQNLAEQQALRQAYESRTITDAATREFEDQARKVEAGRLAKSFADKEEILREKAMEHYAPRKVELETIFDDAADKQKSIAARDAITDEQINLISREAGVKVEREAGGRVVGLHGPSLGKFIQKEAGEIVETAEATLFDSRGAASFLEQVPDATIKGAVSTQIRQELKALPAELAGTLRSTLQSISMHGRPQSGEGVAEAFTASHKALAAAERGKLSGTERVAVENVRTALETYDMAATRAPEVVRSFYTGMRETGAAWPQVMRDAFPDHTETSKMFEMLRNIAAGTHDPSGQTTSRLGTVLQLDFQLQNPASQSPYIARNLLGDRIASRMRSLDYLYTRDFGAREQIKTRTGGVRSLMDGLADMPVPGLRGLGRIGRWGIDAAGSVVDGGIRAAKGGAAAAGRVGAYLATDPQAAPIRSTAVQEFEEVRARRKKK